MTGFVVDEPEWLTTAWRVRVGGLPDRGSLSRAMRLHAGSSESTWL